MKLAKTVKVPAELFKMVPEPFRVKLPVVVTAPEPTFNVPLLSKVLLNSMLPEFEPMLAEEVAAPVKVRAPEVEVTVVPEPNVEAPVTVRLLAEAFNVPAPLVTSVPPIVADVPKMIESLALLMFTL